MNKRSLITLLTILGLSQLLVFCGKTDTDIEWEEKIQAYWIPIGTDGNPVLDMPTYLFNDNNRGITFYAPFNQSDSFSYEIKRAQLKIYYDEAPAYYIGYDKYNSRSVFKINEFTDSTIDVIQFFGTGYQKEFDFKLSTYLEEEEDF